MLLRERELKLIAPRARKLAQKMIDVGITPADQIDQQEKLLMQMDSKDFMGKEAEVNRIHAKMNESRKFEASRSNFQLQGAVPLISSQVKEDSGLGPNRKKLRTGERMFDWS